MKTAFISFFLLAIGSNFLYSSMISDDRSLTEKLFKDEKWTAFSCKIISQIKIPGKDSDQIAPNTDVNPVKLYPNMYTTTAKVIQTYFGNVDTSIVVFRTEGAYPSLFQIGKTYLIYSFVRGKEFKYKDVIVCRGTKQVTSYPDSTFEVRLLKQFSEIFKKKKSGNFVFKNTNNVVLAEGNFNEGTAIGIWKHYYNDGIIKTEYDLENNIVKKYSKSGYIVTRICDSAGEHSYVGYSGNADGRLTFKQVITKSDSGNIGQDFHYFPNGNLKSIMKTVNGEDCKMYYEEYFENGKMRKKGRVCYGRKVLIWRDWNENGELISEFDYKKGEGKSMWYDEN